MDVIKITPEDLREVAQLIKRECRDWQEAGLHAVDGDDRDHAKQNYTKFRAHRMRLVALADKLEADKREALEFIPAKGVQS